MVNNNNNGMMISSSSSTKEGGDAEKKRMFVGIVWKCAAELKLLITALVFLCSLAVLLQFRFSLSPTDVRNCLTIPSSSSSSSSSILAANNTYQATTTTTTTTVDGTTNNTHQATTTTTTVDGTTNNTHQATTTTTVDSINSSSRDELLANGALKRGFYPYGSAAYNFVLMSAYRGGPNTFAIIGLSSKPLHVYGKPTYRCIWIPNNHQQQNNNTSIGWKILPDWGYGRVYTVVVVNCTFSTPVNGVGRLILEATTNDLNTTDSILALDETPNDYAHFVDQFSSPRPKYDYLYCGSSLYEEDEERNEIVPEMDELIPSFRSHVAFRLLNSDDRGLLTGHQRSNSLKSWRIAEDEVAFDLIKASGLGALAGIMYELLDMPLLCAFIERWHPETNSFHMPFGEMTITLHDSQFILGINSHGKAVIPRCEGDPKATLEVLGTALGIRNSAEVKQRDGWLASNAKNQSMRELAEDPRCPAQRRARIYLWWVLTSTLFVDKSKTQGHASLLS